MITRVLTQDMPCVPYKEHTHNTNQHRGQLKLFLGELEFLMDYFCEQKDPVWAMEHTLIVYAGAAPGNHILDLIPWLPGTYWHLYDPCEFDDRLYRHPNVRCFQARFTDTIARDYSSRKTIFISDIRSAVPDKSRHYSRYAKQEDDIRVEAGVWQDMKTQETWYRLMQPERASLKFRPPYDYTFLKGGHITCLEGKIYLQVFAPKNSTETRLIVCGDGQAVQDLDCARYEQQMAYFNQVLRGQDYDQECMDMIMLRAKLQYESSAMIST